MIMLKRLTILGLMVALAAVAAPIYADTFVQGAIRTVPTTDNAAFGTPSTVACRVYQVTGPDPGINVTTGTGTTPACLNNRCPRTFATAAIFGGAGLGGYNCNQESTGSYNPPAPPTDQIFYNLIDAEANAGTCDHIAYYAVQGQLANNNLNNNAGDARASNCAGTVTQNCFTAAEQTNSDQTPLTSTLATFGSTPHQIRSIGGLSPVPTPRVSSPGGGGCASNEVRVTWDDPIDASSLMKNGVPSPVQGVNLYSNSSSCGTCPSGSDAAWLPVAQFGTSAGATGTCAPISGGTWFALTVRVKGPSNAATSIETGRVGSTGFVGANSQCVAPAGTVSRIVSLAARYAGRGTVNVNWTSGSEGGVQGFYVTRATSATGPYTRVSDLVGVTGDSSHYTYADHIRTSLGRMVYYQLEIMNSDGTIEHSGSTAVTTPGPKMNKLGGQ